MLRRSLDDPWLGDRGAPRPKFVGPCQDLWTDLAEMLLASPARPSDVVAVVAKVHPLASESVPLAGAPAEHWPVLGYDVADAWLLSGLMNCGYENAERGALSARYGPALNEHHLFRDDATALAFASECDERVREHAPFFVYELRRRPSS